MITILPVKAINTRKLCTILVEAKEEIKIAPPAIAKSIPTFCATLVSIGAVIVPK